MGREMSTTPIHDSQSPVRHAAQLSTRVAWDHNPIPYSFRPISPVLRTAKLSTTKNPCKSAQRESCAAAKFDPASSLPTWKHGG